MKRQTAFFFFFLIFSSFNGWSETSLTGQDLDLQLQPGDEITASIISEDNTLLVAGLYNPNRTEQNIGPLIYDLKQKKELVRLYETNTNSPIMVFALTSDNQYLFVGDFSGHGTIRKVPSGEIIHRIDSPEPDRFASIFPRFVGGDFTSDNSRLVTADVRGYVQLWDVETGLEIKRIWKDDWNSLDGVEWFADDTAILLTRFTPGAYIASFEDESKNILLRSWPYAKVHKNGQWVISMETGSDFNHIQLIYYDKDGKRLQSFGDIPRTYESFFVHPEGLFVAEVDKEQEEIRVFDPQNKAQTGKLENTMKVLPKNAQFFGEGQVMVTTKESKIKFFDLQQLITGIKQPGLY